MIQFEELTKIKPRYCFLTKGSGVHKSELRSFEEALRDASIANQNLVHVSSILPPGCKVISKEQGLKFLSAGDIRFCVMSKNQTNEPHRLISASIGLAKPKSKKVHGYISEHHAEGWVERRSGDYAEELAAEMLATTLGIDFDPDKAWNEKEQVFKASKQIIYTRNNTQAAIGNKEAKWTTVISAVVFIL
jgi:arginine decarboxylase